MLLPEGGFTGTHLWLKSFWGLPQLINHCLVGVLCLGSSTNSQPARAAAQDGSSAFSPFPCGPGRSKDRSQALVSRVFPRDPPPTAPVDTLVAPDPFLSTHNHRGADLGVACHVICPGLSPCHQRERHMGVSDCTPWSRKPRRFSTDCR